MSWMRRLESHFNASVLIRIGNKDTIKDCWTGNKLSFGCAANWVHYANSGNLTTGDPYECVFSRIPKGKEVTLFDRYGNRIVDNLQRVSDKEDPNFEFLRYVPTMLTPTLCFYSLSHANLSDGICKWDQEKNIQIFRVDKYAQYMEYKSDDIGIILIQDLMGLINELRYQIPIAIKENISNLTQERYNPPFPPQEFLFADTINYSKHQRFEIFEEEPVSPEELFWKFPEYRKQAELRFIIPHWNFVQSYNPFRQDEYDAKKNSLTVHLPNLHTYASLCIPSEKQLEGRFWD